MKPTAIEELPGDYIEKSMLAATCFRGVYQQSVSRFADNDENTGLRAFLFYAQPEQIL